MTEKPTVAEAREALRAEIQRPVNDDPGFSKYLAAVEAFTRAIIAESPSRDGKEAGVAAASEHGAREFADRIRAYVAPWYVRSENWFGIDFLGGLEKLLAETDVKGHVEPPPPSAAPETFPELLPKGTHYRDVDGRVAVISSRAQLVRGDYRWFQDGYGTRQVRPEQIDWASIETQTAKPSGGAGPGEPVPFRTAHSWLAASHEYGAAFSRLRAHVEKSYVRASAPSPKDSEALVDRVIAECRAAEKGPAECLCVGVEPDNRPSEDPRCPVHGTGQSAEGTGAEGWQRDSARRVVTGWRHRWRDLGDEPPLDDTHRRSLEEGVENAIRFAESRGAERGRREERERYEARIGDMDAQLSGESTIIQGLEAKLAIIAAERDALSKKVEAFIARREGFHMTFNGGWHEDPAHEAFHHGMDTVFNALEAEFRPTSAPDGEGSKTGETT